MENLEITINLPEDKINLHNLEKNSLRFNLKGRSRIIRRTMQIIDAKLMVERKRGSLPIKVKD